MSSSSSSSSFSTTNSTARGCHVLVIYLFVSFTGVKGSYDRRHNSCRMNAFVVRARLEWEEPPASRVHKSIAAVVTSEGESSATHRICCRVQRSGRDWCLVDVSVADASVRILGAGTADPGDEGGLAWNRHFAEYSSKFLDIALGGVQSTDMSFPLGVLPLKVSRSEVGTRSVFESKAHVVICSTLSQSMVVVDCCVSLGSDCTSASAFRYAGLRGRSMPLDWIRSNPLGVLSLAHDVVRACETPVVPFTEPVPLRHDQGSNRYHRVPEGEGGSSLMLDTAYGLIGHTDGIADTQRRAMRLATLHRHNRVVFLHVAQSEPATDMYCVVDGVLGGLPSQRECAPDPSAHLLALVRAVGVLCYHGEVRQAPVLVVVNLFPETFACIVDAEGATDPESSVVCSQHPVVVLHCALGFGEASGGTGTRVAALLSAWCTLS